MNILITGATGFIGRNLIQRLQQRSDEFTLFSIVRHSHQRIELENRGIITYCDSGNTAEMTEWFETHRIEIVIHLASLYLKSHTAEQIGELIKSNIEFGTRLMEASSKVKVKAFINTGTFWQHFTDADYSPVNLYAATKQALMDIARYYVEAQGLYFITLKLSDTFGPGDERRKILNIWNEAKPSEVIEMSPGGQMIDILFIADVISGFEQLLKLVISDSTTRNYCGESFALHSSSPVTLQKLYGIFEKVTNKKLNIQWGARPYAPREVMKTWSGGLSVPGWRQAISIEEGISILTEKMVSKF
ncbi:MAG: NAD-dependent epimerase/dehydratase family protein [Turneriella sp.]|nr:NAD-dependent epimerase/dehydratase family protein [Turneriella sp.]